MGARKLQNYNYGCGFSIAIATTWFIPHTDGQIPYDGMPIPEQDKVEIGVTVVFTCNTSISWSAVLCSLPHF
jgi:hypothetical protein